MDRITETTGGIGTVDDLLRAQAQGLPVHEIQQGTLKASQIPDPLQKRIDDDQAYLEELQMYVAQLKLRLRGTEDALRASGEYERFIRIIEMNETTIAVLQQKLDSIVMATVEAVYVSMTQKH